MKFLLLLLILIIPQSVFAINVDDSLLGLSSTKIRVLLGEPIEKVEYKILNKHSFLYQDYILYFKDDVLTKRQAYVISVDIVEKFLGREI